MQKSFLCVCLIMLQPLWCIAQKPVIFQGSVTSISNRTLPKAHLNLDPVNSSLMFNSQKIEVKPNGQFISLIEKAGLYYLTIRGVLHKPIRIPLWIHSQDTLDISAKMDPKNLDDGTYFESDEYISWIRVTGNFNGYNFDQGVQFERISPKTLMAVISTGLDTIRYQIVGITSGTTVLPGADDYQLKDYSDYEGIVAVKNNRVILTYKADSTYYPNHNSYEGYRTTWDPNQGQVIFANQIDQQIQENLNTRNYFPRLFNYAVFDADSLPEDHFEAYLAKINMEQSKLRIRELNNIAETIRQADNNGNTILNQSRYYKYLFLSRELLNTQERSQRYLGKTAELIGYIDDQLIISSMTILNPSSPLWALRSDLLKLYPKILGFTPDVISYLEAVVFNHPSDRIAGPLLLQLFKRSYDTDGNSDQTQKYYRYMLDRFGDGYYARKAREHVEKKE